MDSFLAQIWEWKRKWHHTLKFQTKNQKFPNKANPDGRHLCMWKKKIFFSQSSCKMRFLEGRTQPLPLFQEIYFFFRSFESNSNQIPARIWLHIKMEAIFATHAQLIIYFGKKKEPLLLWKQLSYCTSPNFCYLSRKSLGRTRQPLFLSSKFFG